MNRRASEGAEPAQRRHETRGFVAPDPVSPVTTVVGAATRRLARSSRPRQGKSGGGRAISRATTTANDEHRRGYSVDYPKLKTLCRQAGLKIIDLYEPGLALESRLLSEGTIKKWRSGGRATSGSLVKLADVLSVRVGWRVDWRELVRAESAGVSFNHCLLMPAFQAATGERLGADLAGGFRATILAQLSSVRGLRVVSADLATVLEIAAHSKAENRQRDVRADEVCAVLIGILRAHGDVARLDVELTDTKKQEVLWASSYPFSESQLLHAQSAIATDVVRQICRVLAVV